MGEENDKAKAQSTVGNVRKPVEEGRAKAIAEDVANVEETDVEAEAKTATEVVWKLWKKLPRPLLELLLKRMINQGYQEGL